MVRLFARGYSLFADDRIDLTDLTADTPLSTEFHLLKTETEASPSLAASVCNWADRMYLAPARRAVLSMIP